MKNRGKGFPEFVSIMRRLREPGGCPWDRKQNISSLKPYLIEECYEVLDAIEKEDHKRVKEELGDLLLQVVFISRLYEESGWFNIDDVINSIKEKLIIRHPHVFSGKRVRGSGDVLKNWELSKGRNSILNGIPRILPGLLQATRITEKASMVGFDWKDLDEVMKKFKEELKEFQYALKKGKRRIEEELGDLLFVIVNMSRFLRINPELALLKANKRFIRRFRFVEDELRKVGEGTEEASLEEMDRLWEKAKQQLG